MSTEEQKNESANRDNDLFNNDANGIFECAGLDVDLMRNSLKESKKIAREACESDEDANPCAVMISEMTKRFTKKELATMFINEQMGNINPMEALFSVLGDIARESKKKRQSTEAEA